ncbi:hypothetical protein ACXYMX_04085 [Sporosarcina sp. CAU 1771]
MMKQWNGLMKKEWVLMKGWFYGTLGVAVSVFLILPYIVAMILKVSAGEIRVGLMAAWVLFSLVAPFIGLLISLGRETNRPDVWMHSPASIFKLFGSKVVFAGAIGFIHLLLASILIFGQFERSFREMGDTLGEALQVGGTFVFVLTLASLMMMCMVLFVRVLYLVIKPRLKVASIPVLFVFVFLTLQGIEKIVETEFYKKLTSFGPIGSPVENGSTVGNEFSFFIIDETIIYTGDLLVNVLFSILLFIAAATLFEKKVRL